MPKKPETPVITDASTIDVDVNQFKSWKRETWYNMFVVMFLKMNNKEIMSSAENICNAVCDAMDIATIKHYYEDNDRTAIIND
nr:MAG TPA: hypothetical protein [Caudoviricetes sp.]